MDAFRRCLPRNTVEACAPASDQRRRLQHAAGTQHGVVLPELAQAQHEGRPGAAVPGDRPLHRRPRRVAGRREAVPVAGGVHALTERAPLRPRDGGPESAQRAHRLLRVHTRHDGLARDVDQRAGGEPHLPGARRHAGSDRGEQRLRSGARVRRHLLHNGRLQASG